MVRNNCLGIAAEYSVESCSCWATQPILESYTTDSAVPLNSAMVFLSCDRDLRNLCFYTCNSKSFQN